MPGRAHKAHAQAEPRLAQTAEYVGLLIEPDPGSPTVLTVGRMCFLVAARGKAGTYRTDSPLPLGASLMLELGMYIAAADGSVEDVEVDQVAHFLESTVPASTQPTPDVWRHSRVFVARPPSITGLANGFRRTYKTATRGCRQVPHRHCSRQWQYRPKGGHRPS